MLPVSAFDLGCFQLDHMHFHGGMFVERWAYFYGASVQGVWAANPRLFSRSSDVYGSVSSPRHRVSNRKVRGWLVRGCGLRAAWAWRFSLVEP